MGGTFPLPIPFPYPIPCHLTLLVHVLVPGQPPIPIQALVDSGASDSFLDPSFLGQHHLQPLPHPQPIQLELIDGNIPSTGPITHYIPSRKGIHGTHTKDLTFHVTWLGHFQMVLGFPWLSRHNPCIDWSRGSLTFASPFCSSTCITPPPPPPPPLSLLGPLPIGTSASLVSAPTPH